METPQLQYLCGGYFHQDWGVDHADAEAVIDYYLTDPGARPHQLIEDIRQLLAERDESQIEEHLSRLGCEYAARPDEGGYRGWLEQVARHIEDSLGQGADELA